MSQQDLLCFSDLDETFIRAEIALKSAKQALRWTRDNYVSGESASANFLRLKSLSEKFTGQVKMIPGQILALGFVVIDSNSKEGGN